jgi:hypothetical protein
VGRGAYEVARARWFQRKCGVALPPYDPAASLAVQQEQILQRAVPLPIAHVALSAHGSSVTLHTATRSSSHKGGCSDRGHTQHDRSGAQERVLGAILDQEAPLYPPASLSPSP